MHGRSRDASRRDDSKRDERATRDPRDSNPCSSSSLRRLLRHGAPSFARLAI